MASDRLTIAAARPGMRVRCPEWEPLTIVAVEYGRVVLDQVFGSYYPERFIPASDPPTLAALLAERAPEFLAACREIADEARRYEKRGDYIGPFTTNLLREIERAGILAQEPRTTFHLTPQQFQEMHNAG